MTQLKRIFPALFLLFLGACASYTLKPSQVAQLDYPNFKTTPQIEVAASSIQVINNYADNKYSGEYGEYYAAPPYEVLETYLNKRFKPSGQGAALYLVIDTASLIYTRDLNSGYGANRNDDVYAFEFNVKALSGNNVETAVQQAAVKNTRTYRERRDIITRQQKIDLQNDTLALAIAEFDQRMLLGLERNALIATQ